MRDPAERLRDILDALQRIDSHAPAGPEALASDEMLQVWVVHHLRVIGEAARALPDDVRARAPEIPWSDVVAMRNVLVHEYFIVDVETVWSVLQKDLAPLRAAVQRLLAEIAPDG